MSSSGRSGEADEAQELLLQERLQILVVRLQWSYAALWTLNPHKRVLQWKRGYYSSQMDTSKAGEEPKLGWYAQQFYTTYRSCSFPPGIGFVGKANLEGRNTWLSGDSVCQNASSLEQSQFLGFAKVKTVMCIPWLDAVLELGTTNFVRENFQLMDQIQQVLCHDLLSVPSPQKEVLAASLQQRQQQQVESTLPLIPDPSGSSFQSPFDTNMSDQVWRSDMMNFTNSEPDKSSSLPELAAAWTRVILGIDENHQTGLSRNDTVMKVSMTSHGLMNLSYTGADQFVKSRTSTSSHGAASSSTSVSSHEDQYSNMSSATPPSNSVSPELLHQHIMQSLSPDPISVRSTLPDRTSPTARLPVLAGRVQHLEPYTTIKHEHEAGAGMNQSSPSFGFRRPTSSGDENGIQRDLSLFEAHDQWRHPGLNLVSEADPYVDMDTVSTPHDLWKQYDSSSFSNQLDMSTGFRKVLQFSTASGKETLPRPGQLQRRHTLGATDVLKEVETYHQEAAKSDMIHSDDHDFFPDLHESAAVNSAQPQINDSNAATMRRPRPRATSSKGSGAATKHDEANLNHMMAERRRRVKQKENFATLRRLVPIISKADKASTLVDAIVYLKDLQNIITDMRSNEDNMAQHCKDLASKCSRLEEENKELVAMLTKDRPPGEVVHLNSQLCLHSMKSI